MLSPAKGTRIFVCTEPTDMRKIFDGRCGLVSETLGKNPLSGAPFLFCNRRRDRVKLLYWDGDGYALWYKRLESGTFQLATSQKGRIRWSSRRRNWRMLLAAYVCGLLSDLQRKNVEAIALKQGVAPRTLQRFLESLKWDHDEVLCRARGLVASEHADPDAIGVIDETGTVKSGCHTVGVKRQYNGNRGKVENAVVSVALSYATRNFQCLIAAGMYLPKEWAEDPVRRKKTTFLTTLSF